MTLLNSINNFLTEIEQTSNYRPQWSWAKVMFLQASVILSTGGGCLPRCMLGYPPRTRHPPGADTPQSRHPPRADTPPEADTPLWEQTPPRTRHPPWEADSGIQSTSGWYASYWNAFLLLIIYCTFLSRMPGVWSHVCMCLLRSQYNVGR